MAAAIVDADLIAEAVSAALADSNLDYRSEYQIRRRIVFEITDRLQRRADRRWLKGHGRLWDNDQEV